MFSRLISLRKISLHTSHVTNLILVLLEFQVQDLHFSNLRKSKSSNENFLVAPSLVHIKEDRVQHVYIPEKSDSVSKRNIVRGIVAALFGSLKEDALTEVSISCYSYQNCEEQGGGEYSPSNPIGI